MADVSLLLYSNRGELREFLTGPESAPAKEKGVVDLAALEGTGRGTRRKASRKSYVEKGDAADDDDFEQDLIDLTVKQDQEKEKEELAKLSAKPAGKLAFRLLRRISADLIVKQTVNVNHQQAKFSSLITNLRQVANHPLAKLDDRKEGAEPNFEEIVNLSGKMMLLDRLLPELFKRGHKVSAT